MNWKKKKALYFGYPFEKKNCIQSEHTVFQKLLLTLIPDEYEVQQINAKTALDNVHIVHDWRETVHP
jgi:hypothetical protein